MDVPSGLFNPRVPRIALWIAALALAPALFCAAGCDRSSAAPPPAMPPAVVTVSHPVEREVVDYDEYTGRLAGAAAGGGRARGRGGLDAAPFPGGPARSLFRPDVVDAELQRLADAQQPDGGWRVDFAGYSPQAELEWRGHRTVQALVLLRANGVL